MSKNKYKIALLGGRGFVGQEIIKIIDNHKYFDLSLLNLSKAVIPPLSLFGNNVPNILNDFWNTILNTSQNVVPPLFGIW